MKRTLEPPAWLIWWHGPKRIWFEKDQDWLRVFHAVGKGRSVLITQPENKPLHICVWDRELSGLEDPGWSQPDWCLHYTVTAPRYSLDKLPAMAIAVLPMSMEEFKGKLRQAHTIN